MIWRGDVLDTHTHTPLRGYRGFFFGFQEYILHALGWMVPGMDLLAYRGQGGHTERICTIFGLFSFNWNNSREYSMRPCFGSKSKLGVYAH